MKLNKTFHWISLSVIAVLLICFSFIIIRSSLSINTEVNSVVLILESAAEQETSDTDKDFNEDPSILFFSDFQKFKIFKINTKTITTQIVFSIPCVFYDIHLLPPEVC
ncbi:MAG: hypothetical protein V4565_14740 [Bacteroidota bacterium]